MLWVVPCVAAYYLIRRAFRSSSVPSPKPAPSPETKRSSSPKHPAGGMGFAWTIAGVVAMVGIRAMCRSLADDGRRASASTAQVERAPVVAPEPVAAPLSNNYGYYPALACELDASNSACNGARVQVPTPPASWRRIRVSGSATESWQMGTREAARLREPVALIDPVSGKAVAWVCPSTEACFDATAALAKPGKPKAAPKPEKQSKFAVPEGVDPLAVLWPATGEHPAYADAAVLVNGTNTAVWTSRDTAERMVRNGQARWGAEHTTAVPSTAHEDLLTPKAAAKVRARECKDRIPRSHFVVHDSVTEKWLLVQSDALSQYEGVRYAYAKEDFEARMAKAPCPW